MSLVYSPSTNAFYDTKHTHTPPIPGDAVDIGHELHQQLLASKTADSEWVPGPDGKPVVQKRQEATLAECKAAKHVSLQVRARKALLDALLVGGSVDDIVARLAAAKQAIDNASSHEDLAAVSLTPTRSVSL